MAVGEVIRSAAIERNDVNRLFGSLRQATRIGVIATDVLQVAPADIDDRLAVGGPLNHADILAVVIFKGSEPASLITRRRRRPKVARATLVQQPDDFPATRRGMHLRRKRRAEVLFQRGSAAGDRENANEQ